MKNRFVLLAFFFIVAGTQVMGQSAPDRPGKPPQPLNILPIEDIPATASAITSLLKPKLAISDAQSPKVMGLVSEFLKSKTAFLPLAKSSPTEYLGKFEGTQSKLFSGLKSVLTPAQYTKFLGLKPKASDTSNLLSHLFF